VIGSLSVGAEPVDPTARHSPHESPYEEGGVAGHLPVTGDTVIAAIDFLPETALVPCRRIPFRQVPQTVLGDAHTKLGLTP
jgi:hypothetical protein